MYAIQQIRLKGVFILMCAIALSSVLSASESVRLPQRVYCDYNAQVSFRLPYHSFSHGPLESVFYCATSGDVSVRLDKRMRVRHLALKNSDVALIDGCRALMKAEAVADGTPIEAYDYYDSPQPQRQKDWAPAAIDCYQVLSAGKVLFVCGFSAGRSALIFEGPLDTALIQQIIDSYEVLKQDDGQCVTWQESQSAQGMVLDHTGKPLLVKETRTPVDWSQHMQVESSHFHISFMCAPKFVAGYVEMLESLYVSLKQCFPIDRDPLLKYEIHITKTPKQFGELAADILRNNSYRSVANEGATFGGFFATTAQATFTYTDKVKNSHMNAKLQLAHEVVHQYCFVNSNNNYSLPMWLNESLAVIFETGRYTAKTQKIIAPKVRFEALRAYYKTNKPVNTIRDYVNGSFGFTNVHQYAEAYAVMHMLLSEKGGAERLKEYWHRLRNGEDGKVLFNDVFLKQRLASVEDIDAFYEAWQQELLQYIKKKKSDKVLRFK